MRETILADWLSQTQWADWRRDPITSDASSRSYFRLIGPNQVTTILMDAPPQVCGSQERFVQIARHLRAHDLAAPDIYDWDDNLGFMVLEDLGTNDVAQHLSVTPRDEAEIYSAIVETLQLLRNVPLLDDLPKMTPKIGADMLAPAFEWAALDHSVNLRAEIENDLMELLDTTCPSPDTLSLRDFHAENLIWRPKRQGTARIGLLDFQDAFITHHTYDLASLLRDVRRDVPDIMLNPLLMKLDPQADQNQLRTAFHVLAVQRNLRILGIFHRLNTQDNKSRYLQFIPRLTRYLNMDLDTPALASFRPLVKRAFLEKVS